MKRKNVLFVAAIAANIGVVAAAGDDIGHGGDGDIPDTQPPTETETTTTTKNMLQQLLELFGVDAE